VPDLTEIATLETPAFAPGFFLELRAEILKTRLTVGQRFDIFTTVETSNALLALAALSQETRLAVYRLLVEHAPEGLPAGDIAVRLDIPAPSLSFHLKELWRAGLVAPRQDGRFVWYRADLSAMSALIGYLTENCCRASAACGPSCVPPRASKRVAATPVAKRRHSA
jgi:ArsR family transcriptional regulator, arsenate/arsenite/antimonite-responsive transcriptional repressor